MRNFNSALAFWEMHIWIGTIFTWVTWTTKSNKAKQLCHCAMQLYLIFLFEFGAVRWCYGKVIFYLWSQSPISIFNGHKDRRGDAKIWQFLWYTSFRNSLLCRLKSSCASLVSKFANLWGQNKWEGDTATQPLSPNQEIKRQKQNALREAIKEK